MAIQVRALRTVYDRTTRTEYRAGTRFSVETEADADRLVRTKKVEIVAGHQPKAEAPKPAPVKQEPSPELQAARAEYKAMTGKSPFMGWGVEALRDKMQSYNTRHLEAE